MEKISKKRIGEIIFYCSIVILPIVQFCIFYIGTNLNSFRLAFSRWSSADHKYYANGFKNFSSIIRDLKTPGSVLLLSAKNSVRYYFWTLIIGTPLALFFSFYIYKKMRGHAFFQVMLFLPSIISNIVLVLIFKYFANNAFPKVMSSIAHKEIQGLLVSSSVATHFPAIIAYGVIFSFGTNVLLYSGAMAKIPPEVVEAAELDGITPLKEFFFITFPMVFSTFSTFIVVGVAGVFVNQASLYSFFGEGAAYQDYTIGYYIYKTVNGAMATNADYCHLSTVGLLFSFITIPITILVRSLLNRIDPTEVR